MIPTIFHSSSTLERNLDRIANRVRDEAIAQFWALPEATAAHAELVTEIKANVLSRLARLILPALPPPPAGDPVARFLLATYGMPGETR